MIPNTSAYATLRDRSQQFLDFVVLSCTAVPALTNHLNTSGVAGLKSDHFKGAPDLNQLTTYAGVYQDTLGRMIVITLFSYFEAYVKGAISEIIDFHGGEIKFQATADRRAKAFVAASSQAITASKRKLQEPIKRDKIGSYQKHSAILVNSGFRFPSELLAPYGVKNLIQKSKPKGSKAYEIQVLIRDALCFPLSEKDSLRVDSIRDTRNQIAHGKQANVTLKDALSIGKDLRSLAAKIDNHIVEHFLVLEAYA